MKRGGTVFITGANGFIGANLVYRLLSDGYTVHALRRDSSNNWRLEKINSHVIFHNIDIGDRKELARCLKQINPRYIIHLATFGNSSTQTDVDTIVSVNITGTCNLLQASLDIDYDAFINTGTSSEYGFYETPMKESDALKPESFYAATKTSATYLCRLFAKHYHKPIITIRPFSVYGPFEEPGRFIPTIIKNLIKNEPIDIPQDTLRHDFIYIDDLVQLYEKILHNAKKFPGQVFNAGSGIEYTNDEVVKMLFTAIGKKTEIQKGKYLRRSWDTPHWVADMKHTTTLLQWKPKFSLSEGLIKTYHWLVRNIAYYDIQ
jgi:nucleoside-diphosphate-sugar epimerase